MDRNNGRYTYIRRQGQQSQQQQQQQQQHHHQHQQHQNQPQHQSNCSSLSSSSSSSLSSTSNNFDNHRNSSASSSSASSQYSNASTNNTNNTLAFVSPTAMSREPLTPHDELIRYIREAWTKVSEQGTPVFACNESDHQLKNFKPFNLEEYWGQRLVQNIHVSHGHQ